MPSALAKEREGWIRKKDRERERVAILPQSKAKQRVAILAQVLHFVSLELSPLSGLGGWEPLRLTCLSAGEPRGFFPAVLEPTYPRAL